MGQASSTSGAHSRKDTAIKLGAMASLQTDSHNMCAPTTTFSYPHLTGEVLGPRELSFLFRMATMLGTLRMVSAHVVEGVHDKEAGQYSVSVAPFERIPD